MKNLTALIISLLLITGCATRGIDPNDKAAVASKVTVERDDFKKLTQYKGPKIELTDINMFLVGTWYTQINLRAWKIDSGSSTYQIYVEANHQSWMFFDTAYNSNGDQLNTTVIAREVGSCNTDSCWHREILGLNITREYLEKNTTNGISFQISGQNGKASYTIPPAYVQAFLSAVKP